MANKFFSSIFIILGLILILFGFIFFSGGIKILFFSLGSFLILISLTSNFKITEGNFTGKKSGTLEEIGISSSQFDSFGQIVEEESLDDFSAYKKLGEGYYREGGEEFLELESPDLKSSAKIPLHLTVIPDFVNKFISEMSRQGITKLPQNGESNMIFREGVSPYAQFEEGKSPWYVGCKKDLGNGQEMIFMDERLSPAYKIMVAFHEQVHARGYDFPPGYVASDSETKIIEKKKLN